MSSDPGLTITPPKRQLEAAQQLAREGRVAEAEHAFRHLLAAEPEQTVALRFMACAAMKRGAAGEAIDWLNRAASVDRNDIGTLLELGVAYRVADRLDASRYVLERALELSDGHNTGARLLLANVLELDQRSELALLHYFRAVLDAQHAGHWFDDATTEPALRPLVRHAMRYVADGRRALFDGVLQPLRHDAGDVRFERIDRALAIYLRERDERPADPRQRPRLLYIPGLRASPSIDPAELAWLPSLLARVTTTAAEIDACLAPARHASSSAIGADDRPAPPGEYRADLYRCGCPLDAARRHAPHLLAALADAPMTRIPRHGPRAEIIALSPAMQIPVRHGCSNSHCSVIVGLPGSARIDVSVGGEPHGVRDGEAIVCDASYGIGYANGGDTEARVLVFDIWHPDLDAAEREALTALLAAMVDFDTRLQELA